MPNLFSLPWLDDFGQTHTEMHKFYSIIVVVVMVVALVLALSIIIKVKI